MGRHLFRRRTVLQTRQIAIDSKVGGNFIDRSHLRPSLEVKLMLDHFDIRIFRMVFFEPLDLFKRFFIERRFGVRRIHKNNELDILRRHVFLFFGPRKSVR